MLITGDAKPLLTSLTQAGAATRTFDQQLQASARTMSKELGTTGGAASRFGGTMKGVLGGLVPLAAGAAVLAVGKMALEFEDTFTRISTLSTASAEDIEGWKEEVLDLAGETAKAPTELADALFYLSSAGLETNQIMETLEVSAQAGAVGLGETADVANITASALNAYADSGLTATDVTDTLVAAVKAGRAEPEEFANALGRILPIASQAGVTFQDVAASLAQLSNIGLDVNEGVTAMRGAIQAIVAPGSQAADAMADIGLSAQDLLDAIQTDGLIGAIRMLDEAARSNTDTQADYVGVLRRIVPNIRSLTGVLGLTGQEAAEVDATFAMVTNSTGELDEAMAELEQSAGFQLRRAWQEINTVLIDAGADILPLVAIGFQAVADAVRPFISLLGEATDVLARFNEEGADVGVDLSWENIKDKAMTAFRFINPAAAEYGEAVDQAAENQEQLSAEVIAFQDAARGAVDLYHAVETAATNTASAEVAAFDRVTTSVEEQMVAQGRLHETLQDLDADVLSQIDLYSDLGGEIQRLAGFMETSLSDIRDQAHAAFVEDGEKMGEAYGKFIGGIIEDWEDLRSEIADNVNFIGEKFGELEDDATASDILAAFEDAAEATKDFGANLLEIAQIGGGEGRQLSLYLQSLGPDAAGSAQQVADAGGTMQEAIVDAFNVANAAAEDTATKLTRQIVGTLENIEQLLGFLATGDWEFTLEGNTDPAKNALDQIATKLEALTGRPYVVTVTGSTSLIGGPQQGTNDTTYSPGVVGSRGTDGMRSRDQERTRGNNVINIDRRRPVEEFSYDAAYRGW